MDLPTKEECYELWDRYEMPDNIRSHVQAVTNVADAVAAHIRKKGVDVNEKLVNRGSLLHDIAKYMTIKKKDEKNHGELAAGIVIKNGWDKRLSEVVANHMMHLFSDALPIEDAIVNYADRRVVHDKIVSVRNRIDDLKVRYKKFLKGMEEMYPEYKKFEKKYNLDEINFV